MPLLDGLGTCLFLKLFNSLLKAALFLLLLLYLGAVDTLDTDKVAMIFSVVVFAILIFRVFPLAIIFFVVNFLLFRV